MAFTLLKVLALATTALASNATGPFSLHITGKTDTTIDGYGSACHAGAGIEALCYEAASAINVSDSLNQFYYNYSAYDPTTGEVHQPGFLTFLLPITLPDGPSVEPSAFEFQINYASNVLGGLFLPGETGSYLSFYPENGTLYIGSAVDDSSFNATYPNPVNYLSNLTNFYLCDQYVSGYYYQSIAWVASDPPHNPSCEPVDLSILTIS